MHLILFCRLLSFYCGLHFLSDCGPIRRMRADPIWTRISGRVDALRQAVGVVLFLVAAGLAASLHLRY